MVPTTRSRSGAHAPGGYLLFGADGFLGDRVRAGIERRGLASHLVAVGGPWSRPPADSACRWGTIDAARASAADLAAILGNVRPAVVVNAVGATPDTARRREWVDLAFAVTLVEVLTRVGAGRLIQLGSAAEYGDQSAGSAIAETATARPVGDFATTKLLATDLITSRVEHQAIRASVLRVFDAVGPGAPADSLVGTAHRALRHAQRVHSARVTVGRLGHTSDFLAAADVADAVVRAAAQEEVPSVLNVGRGVAMSGRSMVELLAAAAGFTGEVIDADVGVRRPAAAPGQQADVSLLRSSLQWLPTTPIADAVADLWRSGVSLPWAYGRRCRGQGISRARC